MLAPAQAADAFVLPSRGEGWGRPHVEAMAMGLPLLATNWSGPTAYLDDSVGYPIAYRLVEVSEQQRQQQAHVRARMPSTVDAWALACVRACSPCTQ